MNGNGRFGTHPQVYVLALAALLANWRGAIMVVLPPFIGSSFVTGSRFGLTPSMLTGVLISVPGIVAALGQPVMGRFSDHLGRRKLFLLAAFLLGVGINAGYTMVDTYGELLALRMLGGLGAAATPPAVLALLNAHSSAGKRGTNMGVFNAVRFTGTAAGPLVAGLVLASGPFLLTWGATSVSLNRFYAVFGLAALGLLAAFTVVLLYVRDPDSLGSTVPSDLSLPVLSPRSGHLFHPIFAVALLGFVFTLNMSLLATIQPEVNDRLTQGTVWFGAQMAVVVIVNMLLQIPFGYACDRFGRRPFLLLGLGLLVPVVVMQGLVTTPPGMFAARALQGLAGAMVFAPAIALVGDLSAQHHAGSRLSVLTLGVGAGRVVGPLLSGFLVGFDYLVPFLAGGAGAAIVWVIVVRDVEETLHAPVSSPAE